MGDYVDRPDFASVFTLRSDGFCNIEFDFSSFANYFEYWQVNVGNVIYNRHTIVHLINYYTIT